MKNQRIQFLLVAAFLWFIVTPLFSQSSADIFNRIRKLKQTNTVLYIAAHPDDENTRLITWLSKEKLFRTAYLSLTRGDGGQNLIGSELGVDLGLIRTRELMAAREIDGGEQFFTSAYDFGYSKSSDETLEFWNRDAMLEEMVYLIRWLRPDIMLCRFPPDSRAGHGHHSSSAILAKEAFDLAADSGKFPEQVKILGTWKVKRLFWNTFRFGSNNTISESQAKADVGCFSPLLGKSYGELAAESRSQHKSQGFGVPSQRGTQTEYFSPVAGDTLTTDVFGNLDNYWETQKGGNGIQTSVNNILAAFQFENPSASIPGLLKLRASLMQMNGSDLQKRKLRELDNIILDCAGFWSSAYAFHENYAQSDTLHIDLQVILRNYEGATFKLLKNQYNDSSLQIQLTRQILQNSPLVIKGSSKITQPYWLQSEHSKGSFQINEKQFAGLPWNPEPIILNAELHLADIAIPFGIPVRYKKTDPVKGEAVKPLVISPVLTGRISENVSVFNSMEKRSYNLQLIYTGDHPESITVFTDFKGNPSWKISFNDTTLVFRSKGEIQDLHFTLQPTESKDAEASLQFRYKRKNAEHAELLSGIHEIRYDHIPPITWFPKLKTDIKFTAVRTLAKKILYIKGAGDEVAAMIGQLGIQCDEVKAAELSEMKLDTYDAIVTGIRAYNTDADLPKVFAKIMEYVSKGGTFLVQYNTNSNLHPAEFMSPYPYTISRNRVTEENAIVTLTDAHHPLLNYPNKITQADFTGWVQERGLYFATKTDTSFTNLLLMNDKGEAPQEGSLIAARYGKGWYIYTGLSFFRQLPSGVPGAFRLFSNLISQKNSGKTD